VQKTEHIIITGTIECLSGVRVGGSDDLLQIGGTDLTCIKHPETREPYLPGSSLKGKLRSELEKATGKFGGNRGDEPCGCAQPGCLICRIFGPHKKSRHDLGPSRIIVRDAHLLGGGQLETKTENVIDRKVGTALHPRNVERVAAGSTFALNIGVQVWDLDQDCEFQDKKGGHALFRFVRFGMRLVEQTGIGSGVSKGYGRVAFKDVKVERLDAATFTDEWEDRDASLPA
jgi:CRISPR-associated protein Csm3